MPRGDGTGPAGLGAMTGRRAGYCTGYGVPGYANPVFGCGMGRGRGFRRMQYAPYAPYWGTGYADFKPVDEKKALSNQADMLEKELKEIKQRLNELGED